MIRKYLNSICSRMKSFFLPEHPHQSRCVILPDGTFVECGSYDSDDKFDSKPFPYVSFSDQLRAGEKPMTMGSLSSNFRLTDAQFAQAFVQEFTAAGVRDRAASSAASEDASLPPSVSND